MIASGRSAALLGAAFLASWPAVAATDPRFFPLAEVVPGLRGEARTVLLGHRVETVPLEVIGVSPDFAGPGRDVILARLLGDRTRLTGVVSGMSGSPVILDGRLAGALAYRIGTFTQEAIAAITPIQQMLAIPSGTEDGDPMWQARGERYPVESLVGSAPWPASAAVHTDPGSISTPVAVSGLLPGVREHFAEIFQGSRLGPFFTAAERTESRAEEPLHGGDAIAAVLVRGDLTMAATGTVTLVSGRQVLAFGHPLSRAGRIDFPMARASVLATVPSLAGSFKVVRIGSTIGAFRQDRSAGVAGRLEAVSRLLPVSVEVRPGGGAKSSSYQFELVRAPGLTPNLVEVVLANTLLSADPGGQRGTIRMTGKIRVDENRSIPVETLFSGGERSAPPALQAARFGAALLAALYRSPLSGDRDLALDLTCSFQEEINILQVAEVRLDRASGRPGEVITVSTSLRDHASGKLRHAVLSIPLPDLAPGSQLQLLVGDAPSAMAADGTVQAVGALGTARGLDHVVESLSRILPSSALYARLLRAAPGVMIGTEPMPALPPSVAAVLAADSSSSSRKELSRSVIAAAAKTEDGVVVGSRRFLVTLK
ncbi:MAG: hypothetical protein ACE5HD_10090 [Acidobacteriota bacterium]